MRLEMRQKCVRNASNGSCFIGKGGIAIQNPAIRDPSKHCDTAKLRQKCAERPLSPGSNIASDWTITDVTSSKVPGRARSMRAPSRELW